ncbi:MAG: helix-turn-helix domain-containing protein [Prevotella sp.]|nr:helix-turn-helix domain-containing protein [Prevotella sp.]
MKNLKDRIRELMTVLGLTRQQFCEQTLISPASLSNIFNEKSKPTINHVNAILEAFPAVNPIWLLNGRGEMFLSDDDAARQTGSENVAGEPLMIDFDNPAPRAPMMVKREKPKPEPDAEPPVQKGEDAAPREEKTVEIRTRQITEIRIFYDDQTWETFVPKR